MHSTIRRFRPLPLLTFCLALGTVGALSAIGATSASAQPSRPEPPSVDADDRAAIVEQIAAALDTTYIFADTATAMGERLRSRLAGGEYDEFDLLPDFARQVTEDLQSVSDDRHLRVRWEPDPPPSQPDPEDAARRRAERRERLRRDNYCFRKVERLDGNIGLVKLDCFAPAELGGDTAVAAMAFLAHVDALIFDLRDNGGGSPSMIQLLTAYLVDEPTHLNSFYIRETDETRQFWTPPHVPGGSLSEVPVWVLTSDFTFSGAEEFSYNLRSLERATLVGETTGGGAHPVRTHFLDGYPVRIQLPFGRAINPITGTNWEGTGVEPHQPTAAGEAFDVAYAQALASVAEAAEDDETRSRLDFLAEVVKLRRQPVELAPEELAAFEGTYGPRVVRMVDGGLTYRRGEGASHPLVPVGDDRFLLGETTTFRLRFERDDDGRVTTLVGLYADGRVEPSERTDE